MGLTRAVPRRRSAGGTRRAFEGVETGDRAVYRGAHQVEVRLERHLRLLVGAGRTGLVHIEEQQRVIDVVTPHVAVAIGGEVGKAERAEGAGAHGGWDFLDR